MLIHANKGLEYRPAAWSFGPCPTCRQDVVVRLDDVFEVWYLSGLLPLTRSLTGQRARCDFCDRAVGEVTDWDGVPLRDWSPAEGLPALLGKLGRPMVAGNTPQSSDLRLHSLLSAVEDASAVTRQELTPVGMGAGFLTGLLVSIPLAMWLFENKFVSPPPDEHGFTKVSALIGGVCGTILGALAEFVLRRDRTALARIEAAHLKYGTDLYRLEDLSLGYSTRIRNAVREVCRRHR